MEGNFITNMNKKIDFYIKYGQIDEKSGRRNPTISYLLQIVFKGSTV